MTSTRLHHIEQVIADAAGRAEWLELTDDKGNNVVVFMPLAKARAMAEAFNAPVADIEPAAAVATLAVSGEVS